MRRIGIVGAGFIGQIHSFALHALVTQGLVDARVVVVCDENEERAQRLAAHHDARVHSSLDDALDEVDVVWVCTPTSTHAAIVSEAVRAAKAVFCEKPLGRNLAEAEEVAAALGAVPHHVGLVLRSAPVFRGLKEQLEGGRFGRAMAAIFRDDQSFPVEGIYRSSWRSDVTVAGAGTLLEHSIHDLDLLRWLLGEPTRVTGVIANFSGHPGVEDVATVLLDFGGGTSASLTSVWHGVTTRLSTRRLEVFCERGLLWLDDDNLGPLHIETDAGSETIQCEPPPWVVDLDLPAEVAKPLGLYATPAKVFLDGLDRGEGLGPGAAEALAAHRLVDASYRSAGMGGQPVQVAPGGSRPSAL